MSTLESLKNQVQSEFKFDEAGLIVNPGKFERETWLTPVFWNLRMNGLHDEEVYLDGETYFIFSMDAELKALLKDSDEYDSDYAYLLLWDDNMGFVRSEWYTQDEYESLLDDAANYDEDEDELDY